MKVKIALTDPEIGAEEIEAVTRVLQSKWLTMGPVTADFERAFAAKMNVKHALAVNNCTAALHLANIALGIGPGSEVICPALTFVASANATRYTGADVVFADVVSAQELTISPEQIEASITPRTKAITVVHYAGFTCLMDEILAIAARHNLKVIEDCAHAPFAQHRFRDGRTAFAGALGDIGCFSFFGNKNMTTGEGGMLTTDDDALFETMKLLRSHGMTSVTYDRHRGHANGYDVVALGYNYRIDELRSAIGLCQLAKIDGLNERRRQVYSWYIEAFEDSESVTTPFQHRDLNAASCHIMPIVLTGDTTPVRQSLADLGIQTSKHYDLISGFSFYRGRTSSAAFPVENLMTLPLGPAMTRDQVTLIASTVKRACQMEEVLR